MVRKGVLKICPGEFWVELERGGKPTRGLHVSGKRRVRLSEDLLPAVADQCEVPVMFEDEFYALWEASQHYLERGKIKRDGQRHQ